MSRRRLTIIAVAAVLAAAATAPAIAQTDEQLTSLDRARQVAAEAVAFSADDGGGSDGSTPTLAPGPTGKNKADKGNPGKGQGKGKSGNAPGNSGNAPGNSGDAPGLGDDSPGLSGKQRAADAIAAAINGGNGNGNAFGRGHIAEVIGLVIDGEAPDSLEVDENHGAEVSAMVKAYNELRARDRDE